MNLPNFLIVGAEKSGTTYLKHNLRAHPEIFIPDQKELHFFDLDQNFEKGLTWYAQYFANVSGEKLIGEITPGYLPSFLAASRIYSFMPDLKIIAILRNPIDRAYSAYWMGRAKSNIVGPFQSAVKKYPHLLNNGNYGTQLLRFAEFFKRDSILILNYSEIQKPHELFQKIYLFLDVDAEFFPPRANERIFSSKIPKSIVVSTLLYYLQRPIRKLCPPATARKFQALVEQLATYPGEYPPLDQITREELASFYEKEFQILEREFDFSCDQWRI